MTDREKAFLMIGKGNNDEKLIAILCDYADIHLSVSNECQVEAREMLNNLAVQALNSANKWR